MCCAHIHVCQVRVSCFLPRGFAWIPRARSLSSQVGIQNYSAAISCSFPPSQKRSNYSKLFVVLVVIGSVCTVIITSGFMYICWKRRLPATKTTVRDTSEADCLRTMGCYFHPSVNRLHETCAPFLSSMNFTLWRMVATTTPRWTSPATASVRCRRSQIAMVFQGKEMWPGRRRSAGR